MRHIALEGPGPHCQWHPALHFGVFDPNCFPGCVSWNGAAVGCEENVFVLYVFVHNTEIECDAFQKVL